MPFSPAFREFRVGLLRREPLPRCDLSGSSINLSEALRREEVIEVLGILEVMLQNVGHIFVNASKSGLRCSALCYLEKLIVELNLVHVRPPRYLH
jgi:hypothetical protein